MTFEEQLRALAEVDLRIQQRHEALAQTVELLTHDIRDLKVAIQQDAENIRALARIAELHQRSIDDHGQRIDDIERH